MLATQASIGLGYTKSNDDDDEDYMMMMINTNPLQQ